MLHLRCGSFGECSERDNYSWDDWEHRVEVTDDVVDVVASNGQDGQIILINQSAVKRCQWFRRRHIWIA
jgi:hypothetical protein